MFLECGYGYPLDGGKEGRSFHVAKYHFVDFRKE